MYHGPGICADICVGSTITGVGFAAAAATGLSWLLAVAVAVVLGVLAMLGRYVTRIAIEPLQDRTGRYRLYLTRNGHPWRPLASRA